MMSRLRPCGAALILLASLLLPCAMAQTPEADRQREYYRELDRQREEQQRRAQEEMQRQEQRSAEESKRRAEANSEADRNVEQWRRDASKRGEAATSSQTGSDMKAARARLLKMAPLPDARNPLLGRWRVEGAARSRKKDDMSTLMGMLNNPGGAMCEALFGSGVTEFKPKTWSSIDSYGDDSLGPIHYRGEGKVVWAVPESKMFNFFGFEFASPDRMTLVGVERCTLVRAGAAAPSATTAPASSARTTAASPSATPAAGPLPQVASVAPVPPTSTLSRPSPEVCRNTLLDQIGKAGVNQVRAMSDVRFKEPAIEGKVPNSNNLRIDLRGSACDDPRIKATLYDFDADGMLQSITYVWVRPAGPAPAPIFNERVTQLSRFHSLPPPQSPGRLQADTSLGRLVLQDMPERNLLLEAYAKK
jgi:hypothetical protein